MLNGEAEPNKVLLFFVTRPEGSNPGLRQWLQGPSLVSPGAFCLFSASSMGHGLPSLGCLIVTRRLLLGLHAHQHGTINP